MYATHVDAMFPDKTLDGKAAFTHTCTHTQTNTPDIHTHKHTHQTHTHTHTNTCQTHTHTHTHSYFTQVFLSQVILVSPNCIPVKFHQQIQDFMENFLQKANYKDIMEGEIKLWNVWATFVPYIKLAYIPDTQQQPQMMRKLQLQSLHTIIFGLHNMLGRANHREVLVREKLLDYVICMPHYVPESLRPLARELVHMVATCEDIQVQPPSLTSLVKARLAKMHFGLEKVLKLSVSEIVTEIETA